METVIYFVRHAQSHPSYKVPENEWPLSKKGKEQAQNIISEMNLLRIRKVFSSPFTRCVDTIQPFCDQYNIPIEIHNDLHEQRLVDKFAENISELKIRSWNDFSFCLPGQETFKEAQDRYVGIVKYLVKENQGETIAISTHGRVLSLFLNTIDSTFKFQESQSLRNPDIIKIVCSDGKFNWDRSFKSSTLDQISTDITKTPIEIESILNL